MTMATVHVHRKSRVPLIVPMTQWMCSGVRLVPVTRRRAEKTAEEDSYGNSHSASGSFFALTVRGFKLELPRHGFLRILTFPSVCIRSSHSTESDHALLSDSPSDLLCSADQRHPAVYRRSYQHQWDHRPSNCHDDERTDMACRSQGGQEANVHRHLRGHGLHNPRTIFFGRNLATKVSPRLMFNCFHRCHGRQF